MREPSRSVVIRHSWRELVHCAVTTSPTAAWVAQQLREAFPSDSAPRFLVFDPDAIFSAGVAATLKSMLGQPTRTSYRSPWQNGVAERFVGTVRRELLESTSVVCAASSTPSSATTLATAHLALDEDSPSGRAVERQSGATSTIVSLPRVAGLHRRYT